MPETFLSFLVRDAKVFHCLRNPVLVSEPGIFARDPEQGQETKLNLRPQPDYFTLEGYACSIPDPRVTVTEGKAPLLPVGKAGKSTGGTHSPPWFNPQPPDSRHAGGRLH